MIKRNPQSQAIVTKYLGPTNFRGSRIKAHCEATSVVVSYEHAWNSERNHDEAARKLATKLNWAGKWFAGGMPDNKGNCYVCVTQIDAPVFEIMHAPRLSSIDCQILPSGDLEVTVTGEGKQAIRSMWTAQRDYWSILAELFEPYFTNGQFQPFDASEGNPFVGLTSAPCIAESMSRLDDGTNQINGRFWYFDAYQTTDPLNELVAEGKTVFTLPRGEG